MWILLVCLDWILAQVKQKDVKAFYYLQSIVTTTTRYSMRLLIPLELPQKWPGWLLSIAQIKMN